MMMMQKDDFDLKYRRYLFGDADVDTILQSLDKDGDGEVRSLHPLITSSLLKER